ncbi:MAG: exported protein of unknown function [Nitrospira sp.]|jgi:hypothetical protein|nr:exported protein of unknown function [Nitrospira sp.]
MNPDRYRITFMKEKIMTQDIFRQLALLTLWIVSMAVGGESLADTAGTDQHLAGNRVLLGTVEEVRSEQARIDTGEGQPRFVPMNVRKDKGLPDLKKGDLVEVTVNDQNLLVDVHKAGESSQHHIVQGQLAGPLETGHDKAVIRTSDGKEQSHFIRPVARSKVAGIPVGADVFFLIDELDKIVDVTFGSKEAAVHSSEQSLKMSPIKGNLSQVRGKIVKPLHDNHIVIKTDEGKERSYEVRPLIQPRLSELSKGDAAVLLVDDEQKVTDVAFEPAGHK